MFSDSAPDEPGDEPRDAFTEGEPAAASHEPEGDTFDLALARYGVGLEPTVRDKLDRYRELLWDWNTRLNLTRHTTFDRFVSRDVLDTLAFSRHLEPGERVLDVGSGGGVPGLALAILRPDLKVTLCESIGKKAAALEDMFQELELSVRVVRARVQDHLSQGARYDVLTIRAVARLSVLLGWFKGHWSQFGRLLVLKGPAWIDERGEARHRGQMKGISLRRAESYHMPGTHSESTLLVLRPSHQDDAISGFEPG